MPDLFILIVIACTPMHGALPKCAPVEERGPMSQEACALQRDHIMAFGRYDIADCRPVSNWSIKV